MKPIKQGFRLNRDDYYIRHLTILGAILPNVLIKKEIDVLAGFMSLPTELTSEYMFNKEARKIIRKKFNLSPGNLGNYIKSFINKGYMSRNTVTGLLSLREEVFPDEQGQGYIIKIENIEYES